jgi:hypothetical protein
MWAVGPDIYAAIVSIATASPKPADEYKKLMPEDLELVHVTIEVNPA